jgi:SAM-dependent methyltransferase
MICGGIMNYPDKLNLGCGYDIKKEWLNCDMVSINGIDKVFDIRTIPWPLPDNRFSSILMKDVLEHVSEIIPIMEELHRVTAPGGSVHISVPYWNSWEAITDPTHKSKFNEFTFEFFDPAAKRHKSRPYYSKASFKIEKIGYVIQFFGPHYKVMRPLTIFNSITKMFLNLLASYFSNIIIGLEIYLTKV